MLTEPEETYNTDITLALVDEFLYECNIEVFEN